MAYTDITNARAAQANSLSNALACAALVALDAQHTSVAEAIMDKSNRARPSLRSIESALEVQEPIKYVWAAIPVMIPSQSPPRARLRRICCRCWRVTVLFVMPKRAVCHANEHMLR
jgi:hypothetical protein